MSDWADVTLEPPYEALTSFGAYLHRGRVYLEGAFWYASTESDVTTIGHIPFDLAPASTATLTVYTERATTETPADGQYSIQITPAGEIRWTTSPAPPPRPDRLSYGAIVHGSWERDALVDTYATASYGSAPGLPGGKHGNRMHLQATPMFDDHPHGSLLGDGLPEDVLATPYNALGGAVRRMLAVPFPDTIREVQTYLWGSGGSPSGGFLQADECFTNDCPHYTADAVDLGSAADWGGWGGTGFVTGETIHIATHGASDVNEATKNHFTLTHNITPTMSYATTTDDPTDDTVPGVIFAIDTDVATIYYKLVLQAYGGNLVKTLYRRDEDGSYTNIGVSGVAATTAFQVMRLEIFDVAAYITTGLGGDVDTYTDGIVIRVFTGSSNLTYTAFYDPPGTEVDKFVDHFPNGLVGICGAETGAEFTRNGFQVFIADGPQGIPLASRFPAEGDVGDLDDLGWHLTAASTVTVGDHISGVVPMSQ